MTRPAASRPPAAASWTLRVLAAFDSVSQVAVWIGGALLLLSAGLVAVEVVLRRGFSIALSGATELSTYALAVSTTFAFSYALFRKAHVRVDILYRRFPTRVQVVLDVLSLVMLVLFLVPLTYFGFNVAYTSLQRGATANTPLSTSLWIPQGAWWLGLAWFTLVLLLMLLTTLAYVIQGKSAQAQGLAGTSSLEEDAFVAEQSDAGAAPAGSPPQNEKGPPWS